jgi:hypothetical protein
MMTSNAIFVALSGLLAMVGAFYGWRFVFRYRRYDWRHYAAGRHLMRFTNGLSIILTWSVFGLIMRYFFDGNWIVALILDLGRIVIFGWVAVMLFVRYQLLEESEGNDERNRDGSSEQSV